MGYEDRSESGIDRFVGQLYGKTAMLFRAWGGDWYWGFPLEDGTYVSGRFFCHGSWSVDRVLEMAGRMSD
jgi:hypothetical protein